MNKCFLSGRIGEITLIGQDGVRVSLCTSKPIYKDNEIVRDPETGYPKTYNQWHTLIAFNGCARTIKATKEKGNSLTIVGEIRYSKVERDGQKYNNTEIHVEEVHLT